MDVVASDNESTTSSQSSSTSSNISLSKKLLICEVCSVQEAKYTCPKCEVRTCSLNCSSIHKKELNCSGIKDCTKFIPIHKFTNIDFSSDYRFLEKINRSVESYRKTVPRKTINTNLPRRLLLLQKTVEMRKTALKFLPTTFVRHKQNSTHFVKETSSLMWHIEWVFALESFKLQEKNVSENKRLSEILEKYFVKQEDHTVQEKLQYYQSAGLSRVVAYLKAEQIAGNKFYELDLEETLKDNLKNKTIIEYPIIHVVLKEHSSCYNIAEDNENVEIDQKGVSVVNEILRKAESDESIYKSMKNLLFASDMSDEDDENKNI